MDATTILATICCAVVFAGWLVLPHAPAKSQQQQVIPQREPAALSA